MFYYALQVATGKEKTFAENAKKMLPAETFPPHDFIFLTRELTIRRQGKYLKELQPLFPSYLFLSCEYIISRVALYAIAIRVIATIRYMLQLYSYILWVMQLLC